MDPTLTSDSIKVAVVGEGGVGKSALSLQYVQQLFVEDYDPTIQDNYRKNICVNNEFYELDILDTAGQDEFTALRSQYMRSYECFLLVCSITSSSSLIELKKFCKEIIRSKTPPGQFEPDYLIPCLIVVNKVDLPERMRQFDENALKVVANELGYNYIFTSAKQNRYVDKTFETICQMAIESREERLKLWRSMRGNSMELETDGADGKGTKSCSSCRCSIM